jgi:murein L,D-transpeptidase YcbB/YkuD
MRVVVGTAKTKTPMMAVLMRNAKANPYWNVPPELIRSLTAKRVKSRASPTSRTSITRCCPTGRATPADRSQDGQLEGIASGKVKPTILVRQLPGPWNSMGNMKFEMPNDYGIYLHDTPHKELFAETSAGSATAACAGGLSPLRHLGVRLCAAGGVAGPSSGSSCRGRCRST